jgi:hypothetical protein
LTDPKKREVLLHLSREKKIEYQERIYNHHAKAPSSPAVFDPQHKITGFESSLRSYPINTGKRRDVVTLGLMAK